MNRLKELRKKKGLNQIELSNILNVQQSTISNWENERTEIDKKSTFILAEFFDVSVDFLLGRESVDDEKIKAIGGFAVPDKFLIPIVGQVVAGKPIESPEYLEGYLYIDYKNADEYFALRVNGDSMLGAGIVPGSLLIIHKQTYASNGDIIVGSIDGESTVKRYKESNGAIFLMPENNAYNPILITEKSNFYIFGKVVEVRVSF